MSDPTEHADKFRDDSIGQQRAVPASVERVHAEGRRAANDNRDDSTPAFPPPRVIGEVVGQFVPVEQCEPYPLHSFQMPPPRASQPEFVDARPVREAVDLWKRQDLQAFNAIMLRLANEVNGNSGARAPIQGQ